MLDQLAKCMPGAWTERARSTAAHLSYSGACFGLVSTLALDPRWPSTCKLLPGRIPVALVTKSQTWSTGLARALPSRCHCCNYNLAQAEGKRCSFANGKHLSSIKKEQGCCTRTSGLSIAPSP